MKYYLPIILLSLASNSSFGQRLLKIKFSDPKGNILFYTAEKESDVFFYCDLHYIAAGTTRVQDIFIVKEQKEEYDEMNGFTRFCVPVKIKLKDVFYKCELSTLNSYIDLVSRDGKRIRFLPIK